MHNLFWRKIIFTSLLVLTIGTTTYCQVPTSTNLNYWDFRSKQFYFGLTIGLHSTGYIHNKSSEFANSGILSVSSGNSPGLNVNIITNLKIGQYFDFRFIPGFAFSERTLFVARPSMDGTTGITDFRTESVFLEVPLLLRFKSEPYKDKEN